MVERKDEYLVDFHRPILNNICQISVWIISTSRAKNRTILETTTWISWGWESCSGKLPLLWWWRWHEGDKSSLWSLPFSPGQMMHVRKYPMGRFSIFTYIHGCFFSDHCTHRTHGSWYICPHEWLIYGKSEYTVRPMDPLRSKYTKLNP